MNSTNPLLAMAHTHGQYARRLRDVAVVPGGLLATLELIPFGDLGGPRRPVVLSEEPLAAQMLDTGVPNRPPDLLDGLLREPESVERVTATLLVQVLTRRIVRVRMAEELADGETLPEPHLKQTDALGMLAPGALEGLGEPLAFELHTDEQGATATAGEISVRLERDPFAIRIRCADLPEATVETALDDRDVHGLLCTPPPGLVETDEGDRAFWSWALSPDERIYGLGERFTRLDLGRSGGAQLNLWIEDAWGTTTEAAYTFVPFLQSSRGYGLFFHTPTPLALSLGTPSARTAVVRVGESALDLFVVFGGSPAEILREYTSLTGRATMPPYWAFGVWLSRCRYQTRAEVEAVAARARAEHIPCDVLHLDPAWLALPGLNCDFIASDEHFPDLPGLMQELGEQGFKVSLWELPYVSSGSPRYAEAAAAGYFLTDEDGEPICGDFGVPPGDGQIRAVVDFTNPEACRWWQDLHRPWLRAGAAVFKTDFGEAVPAAARAHNGMTGRVLHNLYPLLYNRTVHVVIAEQTGRPGMVWGRSGWAGIQRYPAQWGGDPKTDAWSMAATLRGGLNLALSAPGIWAHDIGGFYGPRPSPELYIRWAQFGLLSPLARAHGTTPREPWEFGEQALAIFRRYARLRMRLAPYLYATAWAAHTEGLPMLRPLMLAFPRDRAAATIDDQYLLGDALLVAPVFSVGGSEAREPVERSLYLPEGEWVDFWTDERVPGGRYVTRQAPLDTLPLYVRAGSILPLGPDCEHLDFTTLGESREREITLEVYPATAPNAMSGVQAQRSAARVVWDATGTSTEMELTTDPQLGRHALTLHGTTEAEWTVRWHRTGDIVETRLGRLARGVAEMGSSDVGQRPKGAASN